MNTFDTLDRVVQVDRDAQATGNLIGRAAVDDDNRRYKIMPRDPVP